MGGDLIREARKRAGLTQAELARRAGTTQSSIARWESGRTQPGFDTVRRLVRASGYRLDIGMEGWESSGIADDLAQSERVLAEDLGDRLDRLESVRRQLHDLRANVPLAG